MRVGRGVVDEDVEPAVRGSTAAKTFPISASSPMWQESAVASPPASRIEAATASQASCLRLETITRAPAAASARAIDSPMPREAPVTRATRPDRSNEGAVFMGKS